MPFASRLTVAALLAALVFPSLSLAGTEEVSPTEAAIALYREGRSEEAVQAFASLSAASPSDESLKIWHALAILDTAYFLRLGNLGGEDTLAERAYAILKPLRVSQRENPVWYYALAKAFFLNDRSHKGKKAIEKALYYRPGYPEAYILLGDIAYNYGLNTVRQTWTEANPREEGRADSRKNYMHVLQISGLRPELKAEVEYKMGEVERRLAGRKDVAREWYEKSAATAADSRYGKLAAKRLEVMRRQE